MLNNHGWGFRSYIIASGVLLIALIIATFLIMRMYSALPNLETAVNGEITYKSIESDIERYAHNYITDYYIGDIGTGVVTITTKQLMDKGFLEKKDLITTNNDKCKGYALVRKNSNDELEEEAYIRCSDYETSGYKSWRLLDE